MHGKISSNCEGDAVLFVVFSLMQSSELARCSHLSKTKQLRRHLSIRNRKDSRLARVQGCGFLVRIFAEPRSRRPLASYQRELPQLAAVMTGACISSANAPWQGAKNRHPSRQVEQTARQLNLTSCASFSFACVRPQEVASNEKYVRVLHRPTSCDVVRRRYALIFNS